MIEKNSDGMDAILEEEMGHLSAEERMEMAQKLRRWSRQLWMSALEMREAEADAESPVSPVSRVGLN